LKAHRRLAAPPLLSCVARRPKGQEKQAKENYRTIRQNADDFDRAARAQATRALAESGGEVPPVGRHSGNDKLERAVFRLSPGQISPLIDLPEGTAVAKCIRRIPADTSKKFEDVRECLRRDVLQRFMREEIPRLFRELKTQARPQMLWTPENKKEPRPR
jgi:parvulin-like peptidyl-prolyl isomerase